MANGCQPLQLPSWLHVLPVLVARQIAALRQRRVRPAHRPVRAMPPTVIPDASLAMPPARAEEIWKAATTVLL